MSRLNEQLWTAVAEDRADDVRRLIAAGADPNAVARPGDVPPLHVAALNGRPAVLRALIAGGANLHVVHHHYGTAPAAVVMFGRVESLAPLLEHGVPVDADLGGGRTALMETAREDSPTAGDHRYADLARALLAAGATIDAQDDEGMTPLMWAARTHARSVAVLNVLLQAKANFDLKDHKGNTALIHAAGRRNTDALRLLIDAGCDVRATNRLGRDALDVIQTASPNCLRARQVLQDAGLVWRRLPLTY
jgi:ankyrin repeat protein